MSLVFQVLKRKFSIFEVVLNEVLSVSLSPSADGDQRCHFWAKGG